MHTSELNPNLRYVEPEPTERSEEAAIQSEIFRGFGELRRECGPSKAGKCLQKMYALYSASPASFWLVQRIMEGDLSNLTISYAELGEQTARSKQAVQQETERAIAVIERHWPKAAVVIVQQLGITANYSCRPMQAGGGGGARGAGATESAGGNYVSGGQKNKGGGV